MENKTYEEDWNKYLEKRELFILKFEGRHEQGMENYFII